MRTETVPAASPSLASNRWIAAREPTSVAVRDSASKIASTGSSVASSLSPSSSWARRTIADASPAPGTVTCRTSRLMSGSISMPRTSEANASTSAGGPETSSPDPPGTGV